MNAVEKIEQLRTTVNIKAQTPIKMVAFLAIESMMNSCCLPNTRDIVLNILNLNGANLIPAQSILE